MNPKPRPAATPQTRLRCNSHAPAAWLVTWFMLVALALYSLSSGITGLLGPVHFHKQPTPANMARTALTDFGPLAGWQDFRRVTHGGDSSGHTHSALDRHHHGAHDDSAVTAGPGEGDASLSESAASSAPALVSIEAPTALVVPPASAAAAAWPVQCACHIKSCDARRLERPPNA